MTTKNIEQKSELQLLRESYGIPIKDLVVKLDMRASRYKDIEKGNRYIKEERNAKFYYQVAHALEEIKKENYIKSQSINSSFKVNSDGEMEEELIYQPISKDIFNEAIHLLKTTKKTYINIAVLLEIDDALLYKKILKSEYAYLINPDKANDLEMNLEESLDESDIEILDDEIYSDFLKNSVDFINSKSSSLD